MVGVGVGVGVGVADALGCGDRLWWWPRDGELLAVGVGLIVVGVPVGDG